MRSIEFLRSPAFITLGEALPLAARYWRATWDRWLLVVVAVALATGLAEWLLGGTVVDQGTMSRALLPGTSGQIDPSELPRLMAGPLAVAIVSIVGGWFLLANAIAGLRGREITLAWAVSSGLRSLVATMLVALAFVGLATVAAGLGPIGLVVLLVLTPLLMYVGLRLQFWSLAIFDGSTIAQGGRASWSLSRKAVLRVLGWALALFGLGLLVAAVDLALGFLLGGVPVVGPVVGSAVDTAFGAFNVIVTAVLYESQRLRTQPPPAMVYPSAPYDPDGPYPPPPPR